MKYILCGLLLLTGCTTYQGDAGRPVVSQETLEEGHPDYNSWDDVTPGMRVEYEAEGGHPLYFNSPGCVAIGNEHEACNRQD